MMKSRKSQLLGPHPPAWCLRPFQNQRSPARSSEDDACRQPIGPRTYNHHVVFLAAHQPTSYGRSLTADLGSRLDT
ncbi:MAG: hypothetical protein AAGJ31_09395 [Verrucomicrobiota bacterium]